MSTNINPIVAAAKDLLGTPYLHQGRLPGVGLDCIGLPIAIAQKLGYDYLDLPAYGRLPHKGLLEEMVEKQPCLYRVYDRQDGDLLLMRWEKDPQHVAIFYHDDQFGDLIIHCSGETGRVVEQRIDSRAEKQITAVYRFKALSP